MYRLCIDKKHAYYYQVQTQMFVYDVEYADSCVCSTFLQKMETMTMMKEVYSLNIFLKILISGKNVWKRHATFFMTCLLPEILGNWYTPRISGSVTTLQQEPQEMTLKVTIHVHLSIKHFVIATVLRKEI